MFGNEIEKRLNGASFLSKAESKEQLWIWWKTKGVYDMNNHIINLIGLKDYVPVENLVDIPFNFNNKELIKILIADGLKVKELVFNDNSADISIYVK